MNKPRYIHHIYPETMLMIRHIWNGRIFQSEMFDNLWRFAHFPNGRIRQDTGYWSIYLQLCTLPPFIKCIQAKCIIKCVETDIYCDFIQEFKINSQIKEYSRMMKFEKGLSFNSLTFVIDIEILEITKINPNDNPLHIHDPDQIRHIL